VSLKKYVAPASLFLSLAAAGCGSDDAEASGEGRGGPGGVRGGAGAATPIAGEVAQPAELRVTLRGTANLQARNQVEVLPKQGGVVARILVEEGTRVASGTALAVLDSEAWQLQARQAEARATAAQSAAQRAITLGQQELIAAQEVERLRSEREVVVADRELARLRVRNATIRSPMAGVVTHRYIERGQQVTPATPAFAIAEVARLEAVVGVPEREAPRIRAGQTALLSVEGRGEPVRGVVSRVRPVVDATSGTVQVTVEVDPATAPGLRAGQFVSVDIVTETLADRITVPRTAVLVDGPQPRVFVMRGGEATERTVTLGVSEGDRVEIAEGLSQGDTVIVVGQENLRPNARVRLVELDGQRIAETARPAEGGGARPGAGRRQDGGR
jgi:RND family efflux transporter MFP subunit